ncbi:SEC-C metal-binding domain-containing protein, partial [Pseudomonas aeruginosa]
KFQKAKEIVVLGADTKGHQGGSETIFAIDASVPLTGDERTTAQQIMKTYNILDNISQRATPGNGATKNVSRNAPCPCGSNKKYKKCCLNPEP